MILSTFAVYVVALARRIYIVGALPHIAGVSELACFGKMLQQISDFKEQTGGPTDHHNLLLKEGHPALRDARPPPDHQGDQDGDHRFLTQFPDDPKLTQS